MNEKQQRLMQQITEKALRGKTLDWKKAESLSSQHNTQYSQLKKYYQDYLVEEENKNNQVQNAQMLGNTRFFLSHLQRMLMLQKSAVHKCQAVKEQCRLAWKKQRARKKYLRYLKRLEWEDDEDEEERNMNSGPW